MKIFSVTVRQCLLAGGIALAMASAGGAQAADGYWSIGVQAPGVVLGMGGPPQFVYGQPVVVYPAPPVYRSNWEPPRYEREWRHDHHHHGGRGWAGRDDRHDRDGRYERRYRDNW